MRRPPIGTPVAGVSLGAAFAHAGAPAGFLDSVGRLHPALVHFPVALLVTAAVSELLCITRREGSFGDAARFMVNAAAWIAVPTTLAGFANAGSATIAPELRTAFAIHRVVGIIIPVLAILAASLAAGVRRSGQIWELFLFRIVLFLAAALAIVAAYYGGEITHGAGYFPGW